MTTKGIHAYVYNKDLPTDPIELALLKDRHPIGVLAAQPSEDNPNVVVIGWSKCNANAGDRFDKKRGVEIAYRRSATRSSQFVPDSMRAQYNRFHDRCARYFVDKSILY